MYGKSSSCNCRDYRTSGTLQFKDEIENDDNRLVESDFLNEKDDIPMEMKT